MSKPTATVALSLLLAACAAPALAQPAEGPDQAAKTISTYVYMKDSAGNKAFVETQFWRNNPDYDAKTLRRLSDVVSGLEKIGFKSSADAARGWDKPEKVVRCRITLETLNKRWKGKSGTLVGCDNSPISDNEIEGSENANHVKQVLDAFTKQFNLTKEKLAR
jgi:hypothetical protein